MAKKKLLLKKETVRDLATNQLDAVHGAGSVIGSMPNSAQCSVSNPSTSVTSGQTVVRTRSGGVGSLSSGGPSTNSASGTIDSHYCPSLG